MCAACGSPAHAAVGQNLMKHNGKQGICYSLISAEAMVPAGVDDSGRARWDRFANTRIRRVELSTNPAELPAHWNTCTGNWLRQYVYERLTPKGRKPSFKTLLATQLVAGVWHGLFPGYALFFASSAFLFESGKVGFPRLGVDGWKPTKWRCLVLGCALLFANSAILLESGKVGASPMPGV